ATGRIYLQAADNQDHHCLILTEASHAGIDHVAFKVGEADDLAEAQAAVKARGMTVRTVAAGDVLGAGAAIAFTLPSGQEMRLLHHLDKIGYATGMRNPNPVPPHGKPGARVTHLDHLLLAGERPADTAQFLIEVLDFNLSEQVVAPDGSVIAAFTTCGHTMHDLAIAPGPNGHLHHIAFGLESRSDVIGAVDIMKEAGTTLMEYGPSRHGVSGVTTIYFFDPAGNRNEVYNGAYQAGGVPGLVPPIVWQAQEFPRGAFYYESVVPESFFAETT
ncbi:MAG TPA: VOC family protein, partial [Immundisolibacter sp.]|nr:VOC family protein [Immundisolibacter sp.]